MEDLESLLARHEGVRHFGYDEATGKAVAGAARLGRIIIGVLPARAPPRAPAQRFDRFQIA